MLHSKISENMSITFKCLLFGKAISLPKCIMSIYLCSRSMHMYVYACISMMLPTIVYCGYSFIMN